LAKFIRNNSEKGVSNERLRKYLIDKKHPEKLIDQAIELSRQ
jgi:SOS response regulatory protein OraA/RecX